MNDFFTDCTLNHLAHKNFFDEQNMLKISTSNKNMDEAKIKFEKKFIAIFFSKFQKFFEIKKNIANEKISKFAINAIWFFALKF